MNEIFPLPFTPLKVTRLAEYRYQVKDGAKTIGLVTVCRCCDRSQYYQIELENGTVLKEFTSVRKAAIAGSLHKPAIRVTPQLPYAAFEQPPQD